ncbi:MAG: IPT/TIG domain-containing protein [Planctomycetes bacterium]|nr:IPT/TIG domain-containing protein [Planctomycetota bacterium]MCW8135186.1 IPT/TIG domain-containing protein [Planctomycetota bacterium]
MRNRWLALLVVLLCATLAGAWLVLGPDGDLPGLHQAPDAVRTGAEQSKACGTGGLDAPDQPPTARIPRSNAIEDSEGPTDARPEARGDNPRGSTPARDAATQPPRETRPDTENIGEDGKDNTAPTGQADSIPGPPFIRGHARPAHQNLGNTRPRAVKPPANGLKAPGEISEQLKQDRRGLYAQYFNLPEGKLPETLPDQPSYTRIDRQVYFPDVESFAGVPVGESFAAVWTGFLVIERPDDYWLFWGADNGGRVELAGETVLLQDGMVRYVEVSTVLTLDAGVYPLRIEFAQFNNAVADWRKAAACLMWVPQGERKPVPVPPEMLLVPEWMWSEHAPIITGLSKSAGEIGDEITIEGKNFVVEDALPVEVTFAGQRAQVAESSATRLRVTVPIGAQTGDVIVRRLMGATVGIQDIPSNSAHFKLKTQFGLVAEWFDQSGLQSATFIDSAGAAPDVLRLECPPTFTAGYTDHQPPGLSRCCSRWVGLIGLPASGWLSVTFNTGRPMRVTLNGEQRSSADTQEFHWEFDSGDRYLPLVIEMLGEADLPPELSIILRTRVAASIDPGNQSEVIEKRLLPVHLLFPPQQPKAPPVVWAVENVTPDPWKPPVPLPASSRPSVAVGETMNVTVQLASPHQQSPVSFKLDSIPTPAELVESKDVPGAWHVTFALTIPPGVGEGKLTATQGDSNSEPYLIDIANRGLIGFYYDFPQPSGLAEIPDLGPLACFAVRKDRRVVFESVADFDLPFPAETFVIEWFSSLMIELEGDYVFTGRTDDGMRLWLNGELIIDANRLQAPAENSSAKVHLKPGVYPLRMQYFENNQHEVCVLEWRATDADNNVVLPRAAIPAKAFSLDALPVLPAKQATGKRTDGS